MIEMTWFLRATASMILLSHCYVIVAFERPLMAFGKRKRRALDSTSDIEQPSTSFNIVFSLKIIS